jgi:hypothetical protein
MPLTDLKLSILTFPQRWSNAHIEVRLVLVPAGNPLLPLAPGLPQFAGTTWHLRSVVLTDPNVFWSPTPTNNAVQPPVAVTLTPPAGAVNVFQALKAELGVVDNPLGHNDRLTRLSSIRIRKELPSSYTSAFPFERPRTNDATVGDEFGCALRDVVGGRETDPKPDGVMAWGKVIAFALRQPELARALGLLYVDVSVAIADPASLAGGGWIYFELDPAAPGQVVPGPDVIRSYAAALPPLDTKRQLFAAVLFPVGQANPAGYDGPLTEAAIYADGFARVVHTFQPTTADAASSGHNMLRPATDCGIDIGWDDEQVVIWNNRQLEASRVRLGGVSMTPFVEAALGVSGYRIDARQAGDATWHSLCRVHSVDAAGNPANLVFPPPPAPAVFSRPFTGELTVEPAPVRNSSDATNLTAWLPRYFTRWHGRSLVINDDTLYRLTTGAAPPQTSHYGAVGAGLELRYGNVYEFRCRMADLSGGGPATLDHPIDPGPALTTTRRFLRHVPPKPLRIETMPPAPDIGAATERIRQIDSIDVRRPLMGYPELVFAGVERKNVFTGLNNLFDRAAAARLAGEAIGVPDPDVAHVEISVQVRLPAHDPGATLPDGQFWEVYQISRDFPAFDFNHPLTADPAAAIDLEYVDVPDINAFKADVEAALPGPNDPLPVPRARDVRLRLRPVCAAKPDYYAADEVRVGLIVDLLTRAPSLDESSLLVDDVPQNRLNAVFLQPADHLPQRLAQQIGVTVNGLDFAAKPGHRVVFGASPALRHTLSGDNGVITFAAESELKNHWIVAIMLDLDRDWTWDGLEDRSFEIARIDKPGDPERVVGQIDLRFAINELALLGDDAAFPDRRSSTRLIFFDAVDPNPRTVDSADPHPPLDAFPEVLHPEWIVRPRLRTPAAAAADANVELDVRLPIACKPRQMPALISAGIALSPYARSDDYSSTEPRDRRLWFEFEEPVADPEDALFARVLGYGPDPLLSGDLTHKTMPPEVAGGSFDIATYVRDNLPHTFEPDPPQLPIDPELIRVIVPGQREDVSGLDSMMELERGDSDRHYLVPLPPGVPADSPQMFGFWTYEIRVGHRDLWCTAQARHGRPLRVAGVQHAAPTLTCQAHRVLQTAGPAAVFEPPPRIVVSAPYATAVYRDQKLTNAAAGDPRTRMWILLYAQVMQADARTRRNLLIGRKLAPPVFDRQRIADQRRSATRDVIGVAAFDVKAVEAVLTDLALPPDSPLSVLAVELLPSGGFTQVTVPIPLTALEVAVTFDSPEPPPADPFAAPFFGVANRAAVTDPLGADLGSIRSHRILRTSPLTPVPPGC